MRGPAQLPCAVGQSITRAVDLIFSARWIQKTERVDEDWGWLHLWWRSLVVGDGRGRLRQLCDLLIVLRRSLLVGVSRTLKANVPRGTGGSNPSASAIADQDKRLGGAVTSLGVRAGGAFLEKLMRVHRQFGGQVRLGLCGPQRGQSWVRQVTAVPPVGASAARMAWSPIEHSGLLASRRGEGRGQSGWYRCS
jgi:hypothetical protein